MKQRHKILALLGVLSVLTFIDRLAIAVAAPGIQADLHIAPQDWGWILSAFVLADGLFEMPSGALGDRYGQRGELTRIVTVWSIFTALTGWCRGFWQLLSVRFLFGMGAAGGYPNSAGVIARWFPTRERARCQGVVWAASRLGGVLAPLLIVPLEGYWGWRSVFWLLGAVGCLWAFLWYTRFRNYPHEDAAITAAELHEIAEPATQDAQPIPWRRLLRSRQLWLLVLAYGCYGCGSWFYFSWFPVWMLHSGHFPLNDLVLAALPFALGFLANLAGGELGDRMALRWSAKTALRVIPAVCLGLTAVVLVAMAIFHGKVAVVALSTLGFGMMDLMLPSAWALCMAIGDQWSGIASGIMNTAGQAGGLVGTVCFGYIVHATRSYNAPLFLIAGMVAVAAFLFSRIDSTQGLDCRQASAAHSGLAAH